MAIKKENTVVMESNTVAGNQVAREEFSEYVAHLQFHMTLQARNLVPSLKQNSIDSRGELLHQTQADFEKIISRQAL
jgi:hypothetical protein